MTSTLGIAVVLLMGGPLRTPRAAADVARETDGAFCDGEFQADLDAENGKEPRIQSGRWITNGDRALFIAGYQEEYRQFAMGRPGRPGLQDAAKSAGYRDGILDGVKQRKAMQLFRVNQTEKFLNAGQDSSEANSVSDSYKREYRRWYATGYQIGYYSETQKEELRSENDKFGYM